MVKKGKKLPIGIQSIEEIIEGSFIYVDKTPLIYKLINEGKHYFLSRPRRFGKSLLISTLKAIFSGNKKLFKGFQIFTSDYKWKKYPIIHLDFSQIATKDPLKLEDDLIKRLLKIGKSYGKRLGRPTSAQQALSNLVEQLKRAVVLIDEYDKPLIDNLKRPKAAQDNRDLLKDFFGTLKGLDEYLQFVFVTGVSKFSQVSLFSGMNNLHDITVNAKYATLLGYTEEEIGLFFKEQLAVLSKAQKKPVKQLIELMRHWYNGYNFSEEKKSVYNPFSTLLFLESGKISDYWFKTATPTFLIEQIKKQSYPLDQTSGIEAGEEVFDSHDLGKMNLTSLMWQTGYLTIKNYDPEKRLYFLDYPNEEVKNSFLERLATSITGIASTQISGYARQLAEALFFGNLKLFFKILKTVFANIPYDMHTAEEKYYQTIFFVIAKLIGLDAHIEVKTNLGRIDMVVKGKETVFLFEFKIDGTARKALKQIKDKQYYEQFMEKNRVLVLIGVNFSTEEKNISDWKSVVVRC